MITLFETYNRSSGVYLIHKSHLFMNHSSVLSDDSQTTVCDSVTSFDFCFIFSQEDQHEEQAEAEREDTEGHVTLTSAAIGGGADVANPLHKYMMMLMQDKQKEQVYGDHFSMRTEFVRICLFSFF